MDGVSGGGFRRASRISRIGVSDILVIAAEARRLREAGEPIISLSAGEPDFDTPDNIREAAARAIRNGETRYTALDGSPQLKRAVIEKFRRENDLAFEMNEVICGAGAKQILYNALMASLEPGDEVLLPAPYWTSYADIVAISGGVAVPLPCRETEQFLLQPAALDAAITPRTRWLMLNSPSNPSGAAYDGPALAALAEVLARHPQVWVISDDIYEHILYDGRRFQTLAEVAPDLRERTLTVNGVSKAYAMTGWRLGYGAGPRGLIEAMAVVQSQSTSCPSSVSQAAASEALSGPQGIVAQRRDRFQARRDLVIAAMNAVDGLACAKPAGAFYAYVGCAGLIGRRTPSGMTLGDDRDVCRFLLGEAGVAVVPGSSFGLAPYFRISYAASDADLTTAMRRIGEACDRLA